MSIVAIIQAVQHTRPRVENGCVTCEIMVRIYRNSLGDKIVKRYW